MCGSLMCWYVMGPQHMDIDYKLAVVLIRGGAQEEKEERKVD